jgi:hypothetical protein
MPSGQSLDISYLDFFSGAESAGLEIAGSELVGAGGAIYLVWLRFGRE